MLPTIGVDLLHLPRLCALLGRRNGSYLHRFASRILTSSELATFRALSASPSPPSIVRWLGVRWAAKEAAFKAVSGMSGARRLLWKEVEVRYWDTGRPYLWMVREGREAELSISHDGEYVVAMAMVPAR